MAVNTAVFTTGIKVLLKGLTPVGVAHAWFLGASIYSAFGAGGYLLVCLYFIFGSVVSGPVLAWASALHCSMLQQQWSWPVQPHPAAQCDQSSTTTLLAPAASCSEPVHAASQPAGQPAS